MNNCLQRFTQLIAICILATGMFGCATARHEGEIETISADSGATLPEPQASQTKSKSDESDSDGRPGAGHVLLMYLPNRLLDVTDLVRLRARVGPGFAVGARATTLLDVYLGSYVGIFAGLPGPRMKRGLRSPVGFESYSGIGVSVAEATIEGGIGPGYSDTEFGINLHLLLIGLDLGVDPVELLDFAAGLFTLEIRKDDL